jgi:hypothetical protein
MSTPEAGSALARQDGKASKVDRWAERGVVMDRPEIYCETAEQS